MSEKRFYVETVAVRDKVITDKDKFYSYEDLDEIVDLLNEQQENINKLKEENEHLRKELDNFRPVLFQDIQGTVILYSKGDIDE